MYGSRLDLLKIPRWNGDGLENNRLNPEGSVHIEIPNPSPLQQQLTEMIGFWYPTDRLEDMDPRAQGFIISLPYTIQHSAAQEKLDLDAALDHLFAVKDNPEVKAHLQH